MCSGPSKAAHAPEKASHGGIFEATGKRSVQRPIMKKMIWVKVAHHEGWACSECAWIFNPSGPPVGLSLDEMKRNFERQRDKEFAFHVCAQHTRVKSEGSAAGSATDKPKPRRSDDHG
jgi:hypothetical protein